MSLQSILAIIIINYYLDFGRGIHISSFVILALSGCSRVSIEKGFGKQSGWKELCRTWLETVFAQQAHPFFKLGLYVGGWGAAEGGEGGHRY